MQTGNHLEVPKINGDHRIIVYECRSSDHEVHRRDDDSSCALLTIDAASKICRFARIRTNKESGCYLFEKCPMPFFQNRIRSAIHCVNQLRKANCGEGRFLIASK